MLWSLAVLIVRQARGELLRGCLLGPGDGAGGIRGRGSGATHCGHGRGHQTNANVIASTASPVAIQAA